MKIAEMPAWRELDALIAEKVMQLPHGVHDISAWTTRDGTILLHDNQKAAYLPQYSTDIASAWLVVEKMLSLPEFGDSDESCWRAAWVSKFYTKHAEAMTASECSLHVCRAALLALGITDA